MAGTPVEKRVNVCREARELLGAEAVAGYVRLIRTTPSTCYVCNGIVRHDSADPVSLSVATFLREPDEPQNVQVMITHQTCSHSSVTALTFEHPGAEGMAKDPPAFSITRPSGTRVALIFERGVLMHHVPLDGGEIRNGWIETCLSAGLHLVTEPFFDFERRAPGWRMTIDDPDWGFLIEGPDGQRMSGRDPIAPELMEIFTEQRRCLVITGAALLQADTAKSLSTVTADVVLEQLEQARLDGRMVGGVMEVDLLRVPQAEDELIIQSLQGRQRLGRRRHLLLRRRARQLD
jgi:hypothetical protein